MANILGNVASYILQKPVDPVINEVNYLCCFKSYVEKFEDKREILAAKQQDVKINIENASGVSRVKNEALQWAQKADNLIAVETKTKKKWVFGLCPNCWWQYLRGKELAEKTLEIEQLLQRCSSKIVAGPADVPGIQYYSLHNFIHFESRKLKFQDLMDALEDENCNVIGLQGMGGAGKTSLVIEVGVRLEESKFDKVILLVVSNPPDFKKIRGEIARHLGLTLEEGREEEHSKTIWSRITNMKEKLLIILDDVWEEFDLIKDLGIPSGLQRKGCSVLITTRNSNVCEAMRCQRTIQLETLTDKDALNLFLIHASINNSSSRLKGVAQNIVKQCGGLPVAIVAVARTLKNQPLAVWKEALKTLKNSESVFDANENVTKVYQCLKLSYDNLKNGKAKQLFLLCSLFPEDFEIPIELLSRIGIGVGIFGEVVKYSTSRGKVLSSIQELLDSCLLLNTEEECVKMHDLVREVALWIANNDIQVIMDSKTTVKANMRYLFWNIDTFPNQFDGTKLEILLLNINSLEDLKVPDAFFDEMTRLKVLRLKCTHVCSQILDSSLLYSLNSLKDIRSLFLMNLKLGDISILGNLTTLETLELNDCSFIQLPEEILELKKLKLLEVRECKIKVNNPFEVIERCSQLEELYFVDNGYYIYEDAVSQNVSRPTLERYQISAFELPDEFEKYGSISRYFFPDSWRHIISEVTFKQLVGTAELLMLGGYDETRWKNLVPDIVPVEDGGMNDLIILNLYSWPNIQCLIDTRNLYTDMTAFSKLVELHLFEMDIEDLYLGSLPSGFLEQLEIMELKTCLRLGSILFNGKLNLCHLKAIELEDCPLLTSIFQSCTAQSLVQLEELIIHNCHALKYIITDENSREEIAGDDGDSDQKAFGSLLQKLKTLRIARCDKLEMVLPVLFAGDLSLLEALCIRECEELKYIFGKYQVEDHVLHQNDGEILLPSLKEMELSGVPCLIDICGEYHKPMSSSMQKPSSSTSTDNSVEKHPNRNKVAFSWASACCFLNQSRPTSEATKVAVSKERSPHSIISPGLHAPKKWVETVDTAQCLMRQLFNFRNIKKIELANFSSIVSLFTLSVASMILWEELTIRKWDGLKHLIMNEADGHNDLINYSSIFPKLEKLEIWDCKDLEFLFPSTLSGGLKTLKFLTIKNAPELKYVVGKSLGEDHLSSQNQNDENEIHFDLPALEVLCLGDVPKIISTFAMNYYLVWPSLQIIVLENCNIKSFTNLMVCSDEGQLKWKTSKDASTEGGPSLHAAQSLLRQPLNNIRAMKVVNCSNLISLLTLPIASTILMEILTIEECHELKSMVADEGDAEALMNYNSIFPNLKELNVSSCHALEYLFPASVFRSPIHLKHVVITNAPKLKYVFGTSHHEDNFPHENQNAETYYIDFPALESLCLEVVPNLISICPSNYYLRGLSLKSIVLDTSPEFTIRSFTDFMVCSRARQQDSATTMAIKMRLQTLTDLAVYESKIEEIFNLTHLNVNNSEIEDIFNREGLEPLRSSLEYLTLQNLSELRNICVGPKYILSLSNLRKLKIIACRKLKAVFPASTLRSLPELWKLEILDCEELVHIIEEDNMENDDDNHLHHKPCFPKLYELHVSYCDRLRYLFSISMSGILPNLMFLSIKEASKLEHILIRRGEMKEMVIKDVLPELYSLRLEELPNLVSICHGIDFQTVRISSEVYNCPNFSFYEPTTTQLQASPQNLVSEVQATTKEKLSSHFNSNQLDMGEAKGRQDLETQQSIIGSPSFSKTIEVRVEEGPSLETSYPGPLTSPKGSVTSPILTVSTIGGSTSTAAKIFEEEENEEGDPFVPPTTMTMTKQTFETILRPSPVLLKASTSIEQTPSTPTKPTYCVKFQDTVETTNKPTHEAMDTNQSKSHVLAIVPSRGSNIAIPPLTSLPEGVNDEVIKEVNVAQNESEVSVASDGSMSYGQNESSLVWVSKPQERGVTMFDEQLADDIGGQGGQVNASGDVGVDPSSLAESEWESSYSGGPLVEHDAKKSDVVQVSLLPLPSPLSAFVENTPPFSKTTDSLTVPEVQEIVDLMKLEGVEPFMLAKAFETQPQLCLSTEDRSTRMLCFSYRVLLDILNILATRTPFTITEAEKRLLAENLKDASVLGFDKDWLEFIKVKVFDCDIPEVHGTQEVLKCLEDDLKTNEAALATVCDQETVAAMAVKVAQKELEAAQSRFDAAQQEHANVRAFHTQLSEARQGILVRRDECLETIAAKDKPFGF